MIRDLELKGNELLIYACIYGFSQAENQVFSGSLQYLADWTNSTKQGVTKCLKSLVEKGFIVKTDRVINGVKFCEYHTTELNEVLNFVAYPMQQSLTGGIQQSLPNNIPLDNLKKNIDYKHIRDMFNDICISFPRLTVLTDKRKQAIKARLNTYTIDDFKKCFENAEASSFLKGSNKRNWVATFDWLIKDSNMAKVLEGNYADKGNTPQAVKSSFDTDEFFNAALNRGKVSPRTALEREAAARMEAKAEEAPKNGEELAQRARDLIQKLQGGGDEKS
jgi:predicted transcriptional regulator